MTNFKSGLGTVTRIIGLAATISVFGIGSSIAANCNHVNGTWTNKFNNIPYDCNDDQNEPGTTNSAACAVLDTIKNTCCSSGSSIPDTVPCVDSLCQANDAVLTGGGVNTSICY